MFIAPMNTSDALKSNAVSLVTPRSLMAPPPMS